MSPLQGVGVEGICLGEPCSGWSGVRLPPCLGLLHCAKCHALGQSGLPCSAPAWPAMPESLSDAQSPEEPSVPNFCFHSLPGPCLLEARSPFNQAVLGP